MQKFILLMIFGFLSEYFTAQVYFYPEGTHFINPYNVTVSGNGTLYYTTDGSTPTLSSASSVNNFVVYIDQNKTIKTFFVNGSGISSPIETKKYFTGQIPSAKVFFKPPSSWINACTMVNMVNPNGINGPSVVSPIYPGEPMSNTGCEGWYKKDGYFYEEGHVYFNNCFPVDGIPGAINTPGLIVGSVVYYDFSSGPISNPPACLFLSTNETKEKATLVKILQNPVEENLLFETDLKFKEYSIVNSEGRILKKEVSKDKKIEVSYLPKGNYFIKLLSVDNQNVVIQFIKK